MTNSKCLLIIDVQKAMFEYSEIKLYQESTALKNIETLIQKARNANIPIVYIQHTENTGEYQNGTPSWEIHDLIKPLPHDYVVEKGSWDGFLETTLDEVLQSLHVKELIIAGMQTEFCLDTTLRRAYSIGYRSTVVKDAHSTFDNGIITGEQIVAHHNKIWDGRFATVVMTDNVVF